MASHFWIIIKKLLVPQLWEKSGGGGQETG